VSSRAELSKSSSSDDVDGGGTSFLVLQKMAGAWEDSVRYVHAAMEETPRVKLAGTREVRGRGAVTPKHSTFSQNQSRLLVEGAQFIVVTSIFGGAGPGPGAGAGAGVGAGAVSGGVFVVLDIIIRGCGSGGARGGGGGGGGTFCGVDAYLEDASLPPPTQRPRQRPGVMRTRVRGS
jgi:hypothetical protein